MTGETKNLSDGSAQALQALLHSLTPGVTSGADGKLSPAAVEKLSTRLSELVGDKTGEPQRRNESGQLLNEDGLPIIDIAEPVSDAHPALEFPNEDAPVPLAALPISERERRRRERDRILDLLEEEERMEQAREQAREEISPERRQEILQKRKIAAQEELARLKAAKDMQRKMGKALLRDTTSSRDKQPPEGSPNVVVPEVSNPRKAVTFADEVEDAEVEASESREAETPDWGDVVPARLRAKGGPSLVSNAQTDSTPMKMHVVERIPGKPVDAPQSDSDDESEPPDSPTIADSDEERGFDSDEELAEEVDVDFARHQREIALEYNSKRARIAETTLHDQNANEASEHFSNQSSRKPVMSHFQGNRLASSFNAAAPSSSTSLGGNVIPAQTFQRAIRMGKLDSDNQLVGADAGDSGSDEEDYAAMQEITELLQKGEVYNLGPDGNYLHMVPPATSSPDIQSPVATPAGPPSSRKPATSKFKLAHSGRSNAAAPSSADVSRSSTPTSNEARSSPKLPAPMAESHPSTVPSSSKPTVMSTVVEKSPPSQNAAFTSMIVDSPSFPQSRRPQQPPTVVRAADKPAKVSKFLADRM
ncbi:hypothetical protein K438DRAFT_1805635 [Mycena galopus ATCC 62051]|nr:hypothetical protein K438DRAFT_1805635 [Mycena galopus ATCC 62051]